VPEIFHSIEIHFRACWNLLLWADRANYGGVEAKIVERNGEDKELDDDDGDNIVRFWNMATYLPEAGNIQTKFV